MNKTSLTKLLKQTKMVDIGLEGIGGVKARLTEMEMEK